MSGGSIGGHQSARMISDTWLTPPRVLKALGDFDLDPCAAPEPRPWPTAAHHIALPADGLAAEWKGRVWLNPPYSRDAKMAEHGHGTALTFARTETSWFTRYIWHRASGLLFLEGRLYFHRADGVRAAANSGAPSVLVAYGHEDATALADCGLAGAFVPRWRSGRHTG